MKKYWAILGFLLIAVSFELSAATIPLGFVEDTIGLPPAGVNGEFENTYTFTTKNATAIGVSITTVSFGPTGVIDDFKSTLDGKPLELDKINQGKFIIQLLNAGTSSLGNEHELVVKGTAPNGGNYDGTLVVTSNPNAVPIPAAMWLFGSAFIGVMSLSRRTLI